MGRRVLVDEAQRRAAAQAASDVLCRQLNVECFELPEGVEVPGPYSPQTSPLWPEWSWHAYHCASAHVAATEEAPKVATGVNYNPIQWARAQSTPNRG